MNIDKTRLKKAFVGIVAALFVLILSGAVESPNIRIFIYNHTESVPIGWYLVLPEWFVEMFPYKDGDIVCYDLPDEIRSIAVERNWIDEEDIFVKEIYASSGEDYRITESGSRRQFYVGDEYIGEVLPSDSKGNPMPSIKSGYYSVPKDHFLMVSQNPMSFDSRYFGTVPKSAVLFRVIPITAFHF